MQAEQFPDLQLQPLDGFITSCRTYFVEIDNDRSNSGSGRQANMLMRLFCNASIC